MELQYKAHKNIEELDFNNAISENSELLTKNLLKLIQMQVRKDR